MSVLIKCSGNSLVFLTSYVLTFSASFLSCLLLTQPCLFVGLPFQPHFFFIYTWASLVAQTLKHLLTMRETQVRSLGWEDPLEKKMAAHSSTLTWKTPGMEEPGRVQSMGSQRVGHD